MWKNLCIVTQISYLSCVVYNNTINNIILNIGYYKSTELGHLNKHKTKEFAIRILFHHNYGIVCG
jgi:hypothetical protein